MEGSPLYVADTTTPQTVQFRLAFDDMSDGWAEFCGLLVSVSFVVRIPAHGELMFCNCAVVCKLHFLISACLSDVYDHRGFNKTNLSFIMHYFLRVMRCTVGEGAEDRRDIDEETQVVVRSCNLTRRSGHVRRVLHASCSGKLEYVSTIKLPILASFELLWLHKDNGKLHVILSSDLPMISRSSRSSHFSFLAM